MQVAASNRLDSMVQRQLAKRIKDARRCDWQPGVGLLRHVAAMLPPTATPEQLWSLLASGSAAAPSRTAGGGLLHAGLLRWRARRAVSPRPWPHSSPSAARG